MLILDDISLNNWDISKINVKILHKEKNPICNIFQQKIYSSYCCVDNGASCHMTSRIDWFLNSKYRSVNAIGIAYKSTVSVEDYGDVRIPTVIRNTEYEITVC